MLVRSAIDAIDPSHDRITLKDVAGNNPAQDKFTFA